MTLTKDESKTLDIFNEEDTPSQKPGSYPDPNQIKGSDLPRNVPTGTSPRPQLSVIYPIPSESRLQYHLGFERILGTDCSTRRRTPTRRPNQSS